MRLKLKYELLIYDNSTLEVYEADKVGIVFEPEAWEIKFIDTDGFSVKYSYRTKRLRGNKDDKS
jgi:hypothetical protein